MNLLCALGWHRPESLPRWREGLYLSRCRRCGRELVRTATDGWQALDDHRLEGPEPPPAPHRPAARPDGNHAEEAMPAAGPPGEAVAAVTPPPEAEAGPEPAPPSSTSGQEDGSKAADDFMTMPEDSEPVVGRPDKSAATRPAGRVKWRGALPRVDAVSVWTGAALAGAGVITGAAIVMLGPGGAGGHLRRAQSHPDSAFAVASRASPATPQKVRSEAMVAQRSAGCGRSRRRHQRGEEIHRLTGNGHWVSLSGPGTPCWTLRSGEGADRIP
jgi:hypothetical protein